MKIIIGCLNSKYIHISSAPWCLLAGVKEFCKSRVDAKVMESTINADLDSFANEIVKQKPDCVSFSCYIWNITKTLELCKKIKSALNCVIVLGGPEVAYRKQAVLKDYPFVDYVLSGEGEYCFPLFLDMLAGVLDKTEVDSLAYRDGKNIVSVPEKCYCTTPPSPFCDEYFLAQKGRISYIESSRGCPYRCAFCLSGRVSPLRFFDLERVKSDILLLANSGTKTIKFVDRTFNSKESHANAILEFILQNYGKKIPSGVSFHFEIAGDILKESTFEILSKMPPFAVQLEIGMQSFNEQTLALINRKTDTKKLISNIKRLISFNNMHIHIDLIAGLTGEDLESFEKSFDIGFDLRANMLQLGFLKLLYGAAMREHPEKYPCEYSPNPPYEVISTPWLTADEITRLHYCENALDRLYNSGRFLFTVDYLLNCGFTPFLLFCKVGDIIKSSNLSPRELALVLYDNFLEYCDADILKEKLVCDLVCASCYTQIPERLKLRHPHYKKLKQALPSTCRAFVLEKSGKIFICDTAGKKDFFSRLECEFTEI